MKVKLSSRFRWLKKFLAHPEAKAEDMSQLQNLARSEAQKEHRWVDGQPLSKAENAHYTNTAQELRTGLSGEYNFLEGDVWLESAFRRIPGLDVFREPIMAHDATDTNGLTLSEWLEIGEASGKGIKIDIKQSAAIPKIIKEVQKHSIPQERLIFNADVVFGPGIEYKRKLKMLDILTDFSSEYDDMKRLREAFPDSTLALSLFTAAQPKGTVFTEEQIDQVIDLAKKVGGPLTFPLRAEFVTPEAVAKLKPHGTVSIWNDPKSYSPPDKQAEIERFRAMGVDGMIDLRLQKDDRPPQTEAEAPWQPRSEFFSLEPRTHTST